MSYNGFYTRQEQDDAFAARLDNPHRVGSGFINLGPQTRAPQQAAANWQTGSLLGGGGAPPQVSEIWNSQPKAPTSRPQQPFAPPQQDPTREVNGLFQSFAVDPATQARAQAQAAQAQAAQAQAAMASTPFSAMGAPGLPQQAAFRNGTGSAPAPQAPPAPAPSLMSMLTSAAPPPPAPSLNPAFQPLGNGSVPQPNNRMQTAFTSIPSAPVVPQCQLAPNSCAAAGPFGAPGANAFAASSSSRGPPAASAPPKSLSSAADYAAAAQLYKPPAAPRVAAVATTSVSRKPEASATSTPRAASEPARAEEWECRRCTFLNNGSLWECEMCGFERPGKLEQEAAAVAAVHAAAPDAGWQVAATAKRPAAGGNPQGSNAASGKSKAQSKNEKRRAKKRGDE